MTCDAVESDRRCGKPVCRRTVGHGAALRRTSDACAGCIVRSASPRAKRRDDVGLLISILQRIVVDDGSPSPTATESHRWDLDSAGALGVGLSASGHSAQTWIDCATGSNYRTSDRTFCAIDRRNNDKTRRVLAAYEWRRVVD